MGFLSPDLPTIDVAQWRTGTRAERIRPLARHIADRGLGTPQAIRYIDGAGIGLYIVGGIGFALATKGIDGWSGIGSWWREPIVFQKAVLWSLLFEALGFGCGTDAVDGRLHPPMHSTLYWLRPGTIRLPPLPNRVPLTDGDTRTPVDGALYGLLLVATIFALLSDGTGPDAGLDTSIGVIPAWKIAVIVGLLIVLALRDKVVFLAARGEVYVTLIVTFLLSGVDMVVAAKLLMVVMWVGAAASKFNRHSPFFICTMMANSPVLPRWMKRRFFQRFPDDLRPGPLSRLVAYGGTFVEFTAPLVMLFSPGIPAFGDRPIVAATALVALHLVILSAMPVGVPLEWNAFMIFGIFTLFIDKATIGLDDLKSPVPVAILSAAAIGAVILGNVFPRRIWFLPPAMRQYAGNPNTTLWCLTPAAADKVEKDVLKFAGLPQAEIPIYLDLALRAMNAHGRALFALANRAIRHGGHTIVDGGWIGSAVVGWHCGDGDIPNEQLLAALQRRCRFAPNEMRIVVLDAQPIHRQAQDYRLIDAATGVFERGVVHVADMATRQPWEDDVPVHPTAAASHTDTV